MPIGCKRGCAAAATSSIPGPLGVKNCGHEQPSPTDRKLAGSKTPGSLACVCSVVLLTSNYSIVMKRSIVALNQVIMNVMSTMG